ncbi:MAG: STAS domain-containing protein [Candidatus Omnitrophica bacterium]|nr:STAS domain-containing protein [Candidatus Omnitrophota bacterium]
MQINKTRQNDMVICSITGDIDINSSPDIRKNLDELTGKQEKKIVLDLDNVSYIDSSGLATLVEMLKKTRKYGGKLRLSNLADKVKSLFEITKLDKLFEIYETSEQAKANF